MSTHGTGKLGPMRRVLVAVGFVLVACRSSAPSEAPSSASATPEEPKTMMKDEITITDRSQLEAAVGKSVVVIGIQTRTKQPTVNGVDVDGDYDLSDKKVVARGVLKKTVVPEEPPRKDGLQVASRGAGTFYSLIDPAT